MAVESRIDADDEWFVGEDRVLQFRFVGGDTVGIETWAMEFALYPRRGATEGAPLFTQPAVGLAAQVGEPAFAVVAVSGEQTQSVGAGVYQYVLRRSDEGLRQVLAYGPADLQSAVDA